MKAKAEIEKLRGIDDEELRKQIADSERALLNLRFRKASGQLENAAELSAVRKRIARAKTVLAQRAQSAA